MEYENALLDIYIDQSFPFTFEKMKSGNLEIQG